MLIEFNVKNYWSFKESQSISLVPSKYYKGLEETNCIKTKISSFPLLLRSAVIYGANASGKTNLLRAMDFVRDFVISSHSQQEGQEIDVDSFSLSKNTNKEPSEFEVIFIEDNIRYQFGFAVNHERVMKEWLYAFPEGRLQTWYERSYQPDNNKDVWNLGGKLKGPKLMWKGATRKNALFLSTAIQLNSEQLKPVFNWFKQKLVVLLSWTELPSIFTSDHCATDEGKLKVMEFMRLADSSIKDIELKKMPFSPDSLPDDIPQAIKDDITDKLTGKDVTSVYFKHQDNDGDPVLFDYYQESSGTQKLYNISYPWCDVLSSGFVFFVDELDTSLHPLLVRFLIELIQNNKTNPNNAQLIFTTHDTSVLSTDIFRRDQVWFTEKDRENSTKLYPLSDFNPRKSEVLEKSYLQGRYGALPIFNGSKLYGD